MTYAPPLLPSEFQEMAERVEHVAYHQSHVMTYRIAKLVEIVDEYRYIPGEVYFMISQGRVKIGTSVNSLRRLEQVRAMSPRHVFLDDVIPFGGYALERLLHTRFEEYRLHGEWFRPVRSLEKFMTLRGER